MGVSFEGYNIGLQGEAAVLLSIEKFGKVSQADIVSYTKVFLDNWMKFNNTKEDKSFIQRSIQRLLEKGALIKGEKLGNAHIYSKSDVFYDVAKEILDVLFEAIEYYDDNEEAEFLNLMEEYADNDVEDLFDAIDAKNNNLIEDEGINEVNPDWVISWRDAEIYFDFDLLEKMVEMYMKIYKK